MVATMTRSEKIDAMLEEGKHKGRKRSPEDGAPEILARVRSNGGYLDPAISAAGVSRATLYRYRAKHPEFEEQLQIALAEGVRIRLPVLEATAFQRATVGHAIPVYAPDHLWVDEALDPEEGRMDPERAMQLALKSRNIVGWKHISPSDNLLIKLLGAEDRDKYNPPKIQVNVDASRTPDQTEVLRAAVKAACERRGIAYSEFLFDDAMLRHGGQGQAKLAATEEVIDAGG